QNFATPANFAKINQAAMLMASALKDGKKIIACGNGGSLCDAQHFAEELTGKFQQDRPPLAAIALADPAHISCVANDYGYSYVFARSIEALGKEGDVMLAITTSGNSPNILLAVEKALEKQMHVIALTGNQGGKIAELAHIEIRVPHEGYADRVQEIHIQIIHSLILVIEKVLFATSS
ncbi:MAG: D-sedoheptulose 7-phosphate isomerase, partial [Bacteroidia bacterium]|nr:D-sedoheptulose 7-phosphate isomerase [Bacteroidia bacterium]